MKAHGGLPLVDVSDDLRDVLAAYPLPESVPDADLNQADLAEALRVTTTTAGKWMARSTLAADWTRDSGIPVIETGGMGRAYVIRLSHAWAWRNASERVKAEQSAAARRSVEMMQATLLGLDLDKDQDQVFDPAMRRKMAEADIRWQQASQLRRKLVELDELTEMLDDVFAIIRNGLEGMPDRLERELGLPPEKVDLVDRLKDDILADLADRIETAQLKERDITDVDLDARLLI